MKTTVDRRRSSVPHSARPEVRGVCHVVLRVRRGLPWLRTPKTYRVLEGAFRAGKEKQGFALVQYSVQRDHLHLLVEADSKQELARGNAGPHDPDREAPESLLAPPNRLRLRGSLLRPRRPGRLRDQAGARVR